MTKFFAAINWGDAIVTLLAAFGGAWFAYLFNLKQQEKWDKERKNEEQEEQHAKEILELNYLQTYLYFYLDELQEIYNKLDYKQGLYEDIKHANYNVTKEQQEVLFTFHIDFSSPIKINWNELSFTNNEPEFIYSLSHAETAIHRFVHSHEFAIRRFEKETEKLKEEMRNKMMNRRFLMQKYIDTQFYNNDSEIFRLQYAVFCIDRMITVLSKYARTHKYTLSNLSYMPKQIKFVAQAIKEVKKEQDN